MARKDLGFISGSRKPILQLGTLSDDLMRRDFTVNAMAMDMDGKIIDDWRGMQALKQMTLRTPLDSMTTLMDDPLRLLRALRFSITRGFRISQPLWDAIMQPGILVKMKDVVSQDRMRDEVTKMMQHDTVKSLQLLQSVPGLIDVVFGGDMWLMPTTKKC